MHTFRLDKERWIPVTDADGVARTVSLVEAFSGAASLSTIGGSPLEAAAITRFLLAIAHLTETPTTLDAWAALWQRRAVYMARCAGYVQSRAWDLFDATRPFGQMPELDNTRNPAHLLVYEAARKNNAVLLDHSTEGSPRPIPAAVLARGLITANAYAGSSGGGYRSGSLAMRTVAMLCGRTLDETLMLNLLVQSTPPAAYAWTAYGHAQDRPMDLVRRYLWTSRRVRLIPRGSEASAAEMMLGPGDEMPESERAKDPMVAMRRDAKKTAYVPLRLEAGRALWRSAHVLLNWHQDVRRLAAVDQLHRLVRRGLIASEQPVSMRVCAVAGEAKGPSTELWRDESLPFGLAVINDEQRFADLEKAVSTAEEEGRRARKRIYSFAASYLRNGADSSPDKDDVRRLAHELSPDLTDFWGAAAPAGERIASDGFDEAAWATLLKDASRQAIRRAIDRLPPNARRHRAEYSRQGAKMAKKGVTA